MPEEMIVADAECIPTYAPPDLDHTLYVIFHGTIAFYDDPNLPWIDVFIADLGDHHVYLCGEFLGEKRIPRQSHLALSGVTPGHDKFDYNKYVHYRGEGSSGAMVHLENVYSRFTLPRPDKIWYPVGFRSSDSKIVKKYCLIPVFQYQFKSVDSLHLRMFMNYPCCSPMPDGYPDCDNFTWTPSDCAPTPLTLHIHAEEDIIEASPTEDRAVASQILNDSSTDLSTYVIPYEDQVKPPGLQDRFSWEVKLSLRYRMKWLTSVGAAIQRHPPLPLARFSITAPGEFKDDDLSCGGESGGSGS